MPNEEAEDSGEDGDDGEMMMMTPSSEHAPGLGA